MGPMAISSIAFGFIFGGALAGIAIRSALSERYLDTDSRDVVKLAMGLIGTLSALVLGLLIATAKSSFDDKTSQIRQITARVILLDNLLGQYGPETLPARKSMRDGMDRMLERVWHDAPLANRTAPFEVTAAALAFIHEIERLSPQSDIQRALRAEALQAVGEIARARLLLFAQAGGSVPIPFLVILVFWLTAIFGSFTLFAHANRLAIAALFVCALSVAGAIFLILELDQPFAGLMGIPKMLLPAALPPLPT